MAVRLRTGSAHGCITITSNRRGAGRLQVPTQEFFQRHMGLPLEMKPNYEDFSCQFR